MKDTKERILTTSLQLFNTEGLGKVTLRTIAKQMGISQGNLNYHFKKREDIIRELYFQLVDQMDHIFDSRRFGTMDLNHIYDTFKNMMQSFHDHRFIMLDFAHIIREDETIRKHYKELMARRQAQYLALFHSLQDKGFLQSESFAHQHQHLYTRMQVMGDFWLASAEITDSMEGDVVGYYTMVIFETIFPYLTEKGKREYFTLVR